MVRGEGEIQNSLLLMIANMRRAAERMAQFRDQVSAISHMSIREQFSVCQALVEKVSKVNSILGSCTEPEENEPHGSRMVEAAALQHLQGQVSAVQKCALSGLHYGKCSQLFCEALNDEITVQEQLLAAKENKSAVDRRKKRSNNATAVPVSVGHAESSNLADDSGLDLASEDRRPIISRTLTLIRVRLVQQTNWLTLACSSLTRWLDYASEYRNDATLMLRAIQEKVPPAASEQALLRYLSGEGTLLNVIPNIQDMMVCFSDGEKEVEAVRQNYLPLFEDLDASTRNIPRRAADGSGSVHSQSNTANNIAEEEAEELDDEDQGDGGDSVTRTREYQKLRRENKRLYTLIRSLTVKLRESQRRSSTAEDVLAPIP